MNPRIRFSHLVRKGLKFRRKLEQTKRLIQTPVVWYPYDSFASLFYLQHLMNEAGMNLDSLMAGKRLLDIGAGDGSLSFYFESLGFRVEAMDFSGSNINRMVGIRVLAGELQSQVQISDVDLDGSLTLDGDYGLALCLGVLYHLKNPFHLLERLSKHARFCFLSTRIARLSPDRSMRLDRAPVAYLLAEGECNSDFTNYWVFSPDGLYRLIERTGWAIQCTANAGDAESDPVSREHDERAFILMASRQLAV